MLLLLLLSRHPQSPCPAPHQSHHHTHQRCHHHYQTHPHKSWQVRGAHAGHDQQQAHQQQHLLLPPLLPLLLPCASGGAQMQTRHRLTWATCKSHRQFEQQLTGKNQQH
jgi:hypothetical protein